MDEKLPTSMKFEAVFSLVSGFHKFLVLFQDMFAKIYEVSLNAEMLIPL
jgi:hypothetical protein